RWLSPEQLAQQIRVAKPYGGIYAPHVATIHPAKLVRGLARTVGRMGVNIYENSPVIQWQSGSLRTAKAQVRSRWIVPAVEGYAATLPPLDRYQLPVQSLLVATEPLSAATWDEIGLSHGQAFSESSRQVTYGQRTADNRLVFGARGGYQFAGKLRHDFDLTASEIELRRYLFSELFPQLKNVRITHAWGGNLGMSRRFKPHMLCDQASGIALSGGYGGEGVGASNLGGRTLADLILQRDTDLVRQPWVIAQGGLDALKAWEPEPCRWLGYNAIIRSFVHEDQTLANPATAPWRRKLASRVAGFMEGFMH
ncbi:MAG: FAD-binding oxidoreductase, partial [Pseudomonas sp.]